MTPRRDGERSAEEIRRDIERTREELARTAAALVERADVRARAHERVAAARSRVTGRFRTARDRVSAGASEATPEAMVEGARHAAESARERPAPFALAAGVGAGMLLGWLVGRRRR
jgi:ElaB/YqjD/DUF883 family membrane-anchored ribosome-binding protein